MRSRRDVASDPSMGSDSSNPEETIAMLQLELSVLQEKCEKALEQSWREVERLEEENHRKDDYIEKLEIRNRELEMRDQTTEFSTTKGENLAAKELNMTHTSTSESRASVEHLDDSARSISLSKSRRSTRRCSLPSSIFSTFPPIEDDLTIDDTSNNLSSVGPIPDFRKPVILSSTVHQSVQNHPTRRGLLMQGLSKQRSLGQIFRSKNDGIYHREQDLLRQLEVLQEAKNQEISQYQIKLRQREEAIKALEQMIQLKDEVVKLMREELDRRRKKSANRTSQRNDNFAFGGPDDSAGKKTVAQSSNKKENKMRRRGSMPSSAEYEAELGSLGSSSRRRSC